MGMPAIKRRWTVADVHTLFDENRHWPRYELLDGELLVTPSPGWSHQLAVTRLVARLDRYVTHEALGVTLVSPSDIELAPESIMQPDVFVVPHDQIPDDRAPTWSELRRLLLAVEVLSPSSQRQDRVLKRDFYLANGVAEYWIVDLDSRVIERWTSVGARPDVRRDTIEWRPDGAREAFAMNVREFFEDVRLPRRL